MRGQRSRTRARDVSATADMQVRAERLDALSSDPRASFGGPHLAAARLGVRPGKRTPSAGGPGVADVRARVRVRAGGHRDARGRGKRVSVVVRFPARARKRHRTRT
jgi:hypothetical protein